MIGHARPSSSLREGREDGRDRGRRLPRARAARHALLPRRLAPRLPAHALRIGRLDRDRARAVVFVLLFGYDWPVVAFAVAGAAAIVFLHRHNLRRLAGGAEHRFELRKSRAALSEAPPRPPCRASARGLRRRQRSNSGEASSRIRRSNSSRWRRHPPRGAPASSSSIAPQSRPARSGCPRSAATRARRPTPNTRPPRSRIRSASARASRARVSPSSSGPRSATSQASSASVPLSHHGDPASRASDALSRDELERAAVVALVARDRAERSGRLRQTPQSPALRWMPWLASTSSRARCESLRRIALMPRRWRSTARPCSSSSCSNRARLCVHSPSAAAKSPAMPCAPPYARSACARMLGRHELGFGAVRGGARTSACPRAGHPGSRTVRAPSRSRARARWTRSAAPRRARRGSCPVRQGAMSSRWPPGRSVPALRFASPRRRGSTRRVADARLRPRVLRRAARPRTRGSCRASQGARCPSGAGGS